MVQAKSKIASLRAYKAVKELIIRYRRGVITCIFLLQAALANYLAFFLRFEALMTRVELGMFARYLPLLLAIRLAVYVLFGLHKSLWRYASIADLIKIINAATCGSILFVATVHFGFGDAGYPRAVFILDWLLLIILSCGMRLFVRVYREYMFSGFQRKRMLIIGTGDAAEMIVREMRSNHDHAYEPVGFIDDDVTKTGLTIHGIPILGGMSCIPEIVRSRKPDEILVAAAPASGRSLRDIYEICKPFNVPIKKLPKINDLLDGAITVAARLGRRLVEAGLVTEEQVQEALVLQQTKGGRLGTKLVELGHIAEEKMVSFLTSQYGIASMTPLSLADLLSREQVTTDIALVKEFIAGRTVMVTGAGGSIGSELCRQIIRYRPRHIVLLDRYENSLFDIDRELTGEAGGIPVTTIIADIQDARCIDGHFSAYRPQVIFHAAAYKHVPLMEGHPLEAVKNNVFGTRNLIEAASRHRAESFVLISTDKAVNPTSIMGATKRIAEYLTVNMNASCVSKFTTVRFGNVLGTNGSVLPIFKDQLKKGGPLTVTHPDMKRFFMLIPEAVQLVLIAAASGRGGEIFVLDMGDPVKILDLAENFIRLSGFIPHREIKIEMTGLRPGEKLFEELFDVTEKRITTSHDKLMIAVPEVPPPSVLLSHLEELERLVREHAADEMVPAMQRIVPNFKVPSEEQAKTYAHAG